MGALQWVNMANAVVSYDHLALQVEVLRKENSHLRRELEDNSHHLCKLETETFGMKEMLKQLQSKLEQEAGNLASSGRTDVLHQLKELYMDLTNYYELKHQPHNLRLLASGLGGAGMRGGAGPALSGSLDLEDHLALPSSSCCSSSSSMAAVNRARSPLRAASRQGMVSGGETAIMLPNHFLDGAPPQTAVICEGDGRLGDHHFEELYKERNFLLGEIDREERERLEVLSHTCHRLAQLPRIDEISFQLDLIRQNLEDKVHRSLMAERYLASNEMVHRTQMRAARLEQLEKELHEARGGQESQLPLSGAEKPPAGEPENSGSSSAAAAGAEAADGGSKVEMVFWLLSMLANRDKDEMSRTLLALSSSQDSCIAMRKSGCVPLLVQILHEVPSGVPDGVPGETTGGAASTGCSRDTKSRASAALHNIIFSQQDEGQAHREMKVLHMLEQIRTYCDSGWDWLESHAMTPSPGGTKTSDIPEPVDPQICQAMCAIMKMSFEEEYRRAMNELGCLQVVADLIHLEHEMYGMQNDPINMALRRYAGMGLTNLTFGDVVNKATLCSRKSCLQALVAQLSSDSEELHQVVSSVMRNLSWRADISTKRVLRDISCVSALMTCALQATKESTLKSVLSALWNLSAHNIDNKVAICSVDGSLGFLVSTLTYRCQTNSLAIIESGGGILRNVSSLIATREDYRQILRDHNCLQTLLAHLRSHSLTIVSNACGTLWNLSARSPKDQELLWDLGAVSMLRNLIHSKHKMIAMGSAAALRNLLTNRPLKYKDTAVLSPGSCVPSLYMRKQKAFEAELNAKHLAETFDTLEKQSSKHLSFNKPLRHIESLAKDYASDSGCFDDDEAPNNSNSLDTGSFSVLPMYLTNSNFVQNQPHRRDNEPERDTDLPQRVEKKHAPPDDVVSAAAEKLAKKITNTVAKIDRLVDDITMHTSSEDSFSLSSEDHLADWPYGQDELNEARANSCSPCCLSDVSSLAYRERLSRAHALLRLKTAHTSVSTDSLNSGSTSDGFCGSKDQVGLVPKAQAIQQQRPNQLDLKVAHQEHLNVGQSVLNQTNQQDIPERDSVDNKVMDNVELGNTDIDKNQEQPIQTPVSVSTKISSDVSMTSIKLSPSYQQVPLIQSVAKFGVAKTAINVQAAQAMRRQAWVPTVLTGGSITKFAPMNSTRSPTVGTMETVQKYSVENTPICFSRCSSLSSLSSGDGGLDGQSENELESDSSLEIIEVDDGEEVKKEQEDETLEDLSDSQLLMTDSKTLPIKEKDPIEISRTPKKEKVFLRGASPAINEDRSPSSSSENYIHDTPLVLSRCSSVSSLGSFESPSIASSIQSDPCSEMIDGTISPSDLPDSPGQTMPPSRSKTPCCVESNVPETQTTGMPGQWENSLRKFIEITDSKERFNLPDLETMIYFTVEKPTENFSCASSLSALPLHEHYIQKDVELKLTPLLQQNDENLPYPDEDEEGFDNGERYSEGNSEEDIEILKECINSAMPSKFRKVRSSLVTAIPSNVLNSQIRKPIQLQFNMLPNGKTQICPRRRNIYPQKDLKLDDSSFTDSAEGTPINFSSTTSLSDETLQYPLKNRGAKDCTAKGLSKQEVMDNDAKRIEDLRIFSHFHKPHGATYPPEIQMSRTTKHVIPTQKLLMQSKEVADRVAGLKNRERSPNQQRRQQGQGSYRKFDLPVIKQNKEINVNSRTQKENKMFRQMTHSSEDSIDFYGDNNEEVIKRTSRKQMKEAARSTLSRSMTNIGRIDNSQGKPRGFLRLKQNLLRDESLACYSLSSSVSSLSDAEFEEHKAKAQQMWYKNRHNKTLNMAQQTKAVTLHCQYEEQSSPSSVSMDSEDDLLQKCITSAMPKQRRKMAARKKKTENTHKHKDSDRWDMDEEMDSDDTGWDNDSDLNSVEWRAIQEGANCVVTGLQASKSQEPSSEETESILSFMSTSSFTPKEKKFAKEKKANKPLDFAQRKPVPNLPVVFRGRTVIYTPQQATAPSQRPPPRKMPTKTDAPKNPNLAQHRSKSLHRLGQAQDVELSLPKRSSTPPPRIPKSSSSGSSQSSTPSKQSQKKTVSPTQTGKPIQKKTTSSSSSSPASSPPERKGRSPVLNKNEKSPPPKTQKSPVRIPFMQNSTRQPRPLSPLVTNQTSPKQINGKRVSPANRFDMVRMTSVHSSSGESDRNGFLRQLTFIKESRTPFRRDGSPHNTPRSQNGSPRRAAPGATAVFLCSSRCQELKVAVQTPKRVQVKDPGKVQQVQKPAPGLQKQTTTLSRATSSERDLSGRRPARRTSSESPCRVAQRSATGRISGVRHQQEQDTFKRHASSPSINILSRVTSRSSLRSSSSDSSGRAKSEDDTKKKGQRSTSRRNTGVTWRRIRDEDVPQILKSTLPANALPLVPSPDGEKPKLPALPGKLPTVVLASRKTTDATVQTEDLSNDKTNSSTSPAAETAPVISEEEARLALLRKFTAASGSNHQDADSDGSLKSLSTTGTSDSHVGGVVTFRQGSWSNAARVTPFNYIPSPMACCLEDPQSQTATMTEKAGGKIEL